MLVTGESLWIKIIGIRLVRFHKEQYKIEKIKLNIFCPAKVSRGEECINQL